MGREFKIQRGAQRIVFGAGSSRGIGDEIGAMGLLRVLVVSSAGRRAGAAEIAKSLGARAAGVLAIAREHVPIATVNEARREAERTDADALLAIGGGSAIGLAKAVALGGRAKALAVPTTYSGSEMTALYGITEDGDKRTGRDERVRAALVVYDPELTMDLPAEVSAMSLWNAMAHAVEALWMPDVDRATSIAAEEALRSIASCLPAIAGGHADLATREAALEGSYLAGVALSDAGTGLHHKLCHVLGGKLALPHAKTHAVVLPHVARFFRASAPDAMRRIAGALGAADAVDGLARLARATGVPPSLQALGMPRDAIDRVVAAIAAGAYASRATELRVMVERAFTGDTAPAAAPALRGPDTLQHTAGFGAPVESEALAGSLPRTQNAPRMAPFGLYPELLSGTPFTVENTENSRVWMYRIRPSFSHGVLESLPHPRFGAPLEDASPNRTRWNPLPIPEAPARVDFLDGLVTLGGAGEPTSGPGYAVHLYAANADMADRCFSTADGDLLIVPQQGTLECRTELGWLRASPGTILLVPRGLKFSVGLADGAARGWMVEVYGRRFRLPERGLIGSNGLADARHFMGPVASYEDRAATYRMVTKLGGKLYSAEQGHSPFDVVAWHGNHVAHTYDLSLFAAMGSVTFDHPDPSILTVLTAPLDDHGRAVCDFVVFPGRWEVIEHSFRPPFMHRNAASEINGVIRTPRPEGGYDPGCTFVSPLLTSHGVSVSTYEAVFNQPEATADIPRRMPDESLWFMFESAMPFRRTAWARETPLVDRDFGKAFEGAKVWFDPNRRG